MTSMTTTRTRASSWAAMQAWFADGFEDPTGNVVIDKADAYIRIDPSNVDAWMGEVGAVLLGVNLTDNNETEFDNGQPFSTQGGGGRQQRSRHRKGQVPVGRRPGDDHHLEGLPGMRGGVAGPAQQGRMCRGGMGTDNDRDGEAGQVAP